MVYTVGLREDSFQENPEEYRNKNATEWNHRYVSWRLLHIEYQFQDSMLVLQKHFQTSRNNSKISTFDWPHFDREMLVHRILSELWEGANIFWQYKKSRMPRKVDVLLAQRLHIFLLNQVVLIRNFSRLIFPIWSLVDFRCDIFSMLDRSK